MLPLIILLLALCAALLYWQLVIAEGVYLGPGMVRLLYDWTARRYDAIKGFDADDEGFFLGAPLVHALAGRPAPHVLDVACGTGRLPKTLLEQPGFDGKIIGLDASRRMLAEAARALGSRVTLIWQDATRLPFESNSFDAVTCLEALEFTPDARHCLAEIARVLRPGGLLLASNRIGLWARLMPGHTLSTPALGQLLASLGFEHVRRQAWQVEYDLVWARRKADGAQPAGFTLPDVLTCPACRQRLRRTARAWQCQACARTYPVAGDGVIEMLT